MNGTTALSRDFTSRRLRRMRILIGLVAICACAAPVRALPRLLQCGRLVDVRAGRVLTNMTIVVDGPAIARVEQGLTPGGAGDTVVDLRAHTCMPGLIDMHVHLTGEYSETSEIERFRLNPPDYAFRSVGFAEKTLLAGFTTVRDLGGEVSIALRNAVNRGYVKGPRIFTSGRSLATTGGHADPTNGMREDLAKHRDARRRRDQRRGGCAAGGEAAVQGRRGPDQDHRDRRRAQRRVERPERAVHRGRDPRDRRHREGLRLPRRRARARRRGHEARRARRRGLDRARHVHGRRRHGADEEARHLLRADDHRRQVGRGEVADSRASFRRSCGRRPRRSVR